MADFVTEIIFAFETGGLVSHMEFSSELKHFTKSMPVSPGSKSVSVFSVAIESVIQYEYRQARNNAPIYLRNTIRRV